MNELENELISELEKIISLLEYYQEKNWSNHFYKIKDLIDNKNIDGINSLRKLFVGGMGSFNDFYISKINGKELEKNEIKSANQKLKELGKSISDLAFKIKNKT
ncbi:DUF6966 domain-containing protein [Tenacibaculum sp. 190524A05c]|uniref:DUF6966 domain-containing protein n=1 Tax=Tenacibaculum platacis TaxID=3137852 RepID=A0ABM9P541_9FLAO